MIWWYITGLKDALIDPKDEFFLKACLQYGGDDTGTSAGDSNESLLPVGFCGWEIINQERSGPAQTEYNKAEDSAQSHTQQQRQEQQRQDQQQQQEQQQEDIKEKPPNVNTNTMAKKQQGNQLPETLDVDAWLALSSRLRKERVRVLKGRGYNNVCRLTFMAVAPDFQRRGIGSMMLQSICNEVDKVPGRCMYVLAAPEGVQLYSKFGFEVVGDVDTPHGNITSMVRPASTEAILE